MTTIAYLAPEIPALSATFVYEELLAVERRGFQVFPFSVSPPSQPAHNQEALANRTTVIYDRSKLFVAIRGVIDLLSDEIDRKRALRWLISDIAQVGWRKMAAWKLTFQFLAAARLAKLLKQKGCVHIHIHFAHTPAQIGMYASAMSGIPFTITAHANDIFQRGQLLQQKAKRAVHLLTISEHNRKYLESCGIPGNEIPIVRCGVSFPLRPESTQRIGNGKFRIGSLGRMVEKKGFDVLISAVAKLVTMGHDVELRIAGDGPLMSELKQLSIKCKVPDIVHFEGNLPHYNVTEWLQSLDLFVLACKVDQNGDMDGIPVVLMEAMSQMIPVISTRISGIPELIQHEKTGLLAMPDSVEHLAQQIVRLVECRELAVELTTRASAYVESEFGQARNIDRLIDAFELKTAQEKSTIPSVPSKTVKFS